MGVDKHPKVKFDLDADYPELEYVENEKTHFKKGDQGDKGGKEKDNK